MQSVFSDFIGHFSGVYPDGYCSHVIDEFERLSSKGLTRNRQEIEGASKIYKKDDSIMLNAKNLNLSYFQDRCPLDIFFDGLQACFDSYCNEYDILREMRLTANHVKMQRTCPGGGYHNWHCEQSSADGDQPSRVMVYALYLNTIDPEFAGETEFFYQKKRIQPKENCMIIWPAAYTHTHRGNILFGNQNKYIITGWFHLH
jgi:hypothetical protein